MPEPIPTKFFPDLRLAIDEWRKHRNKVVHGMVKSVPGFDHNEVLDFLKEAKFIALQGQALARAITDWVRKAKRQFDGTEGRSVESPIGRQTSLSFAVRFGSRGRSALFTPARSSPPSVCDAPAPGGAFADERRIVAGDEGGGETLIQFPSGSAVPPPTHASVGRVAYRVGSRGSIRFARLALERITPSSARSGRVHFCLFIEPAGLVSGQHDKSAPSNSGSDRVLARCDGPGDQKSGGAWSGAHPSNHSWGTADSCRCLPFRLRCAKPVEPADVFNGRLHGRLHAILCHRGRATQSPA